MICLENEHDVGKMMKLANFFVSNYFSTMGVPEHIYSDPKYLEMCISTDVCSGMKMAYSAMERSGKFDEGDSSHQVERDIRWVVNTLRNMSRFVPKEFSMGVLLMHLEIIEGVPV